MTPPAEVSPAAPRSPAEVELLRRLAGDDPQALAQLMRDHSEGLLRYACRVTGSHEIAEDVVQDVFIKVWDSRSEFAPTGGLGGYLLRMVRNRALDLLRRERALSVRARLGGDVGEVGPSAHSNSGESSVALQELATRIRAAIDALPERSRQVFMMRRHSGQSSSAVAEALGISVAAVHVHLSRALRRIAEELAKGD